MRRMSGEVFQITFRVNPGRVPAVARLRRLLKYAGRVCGMRCTRIFEVKEDSQQNVVTSLDDSDGKKEEV